MTWDVNSNKSTRPPRNTVCKELSAAAYQRPLSVLSTHTGWFTGQMRRTERKQDTQKKSQGGGSVFSVFVCVGLEGTSKFLQGEVRCRGRGGSSATEVVYNQRDIDAVHLQ